tara:strand:- start:1677 stop:2504 length:828 start_codon:yes stop_codon:yes gene_type:complete
MKNIHILPTDKPSRLQLNVNTKMLVLFNNIQSNNESAHLTTQNIYITSDEEIKEGDWFLDDNNSIGQSYKLSHVQFANPKKIILTTDFDKQPRVQAIDDEFLEWFVKNPSCEEVEVEENKHLICNHCDSLYSSFSDGIHCDVCVRMSKPIVKVLGYKIIIPKEEPKQKLEKYSERFDNDKSPIGNTETWGKRLVDDVPKQETLEDFLYQYWYDSPTLNIHNKEAFTDGGLLGAKWQQKEMLKFIWNEDNHTEGELGNSCIDVQTLVNFIEQFKKK